MSEVEAAKELADLGERMEMNVPKFATSDSQWLTFKQIARSVWEE